MGPKVRRGPGTRDNGEVVNWWTGEVAGESV